MMITHNYHNSKYCFDEKQLVRALVDDRLQLGNVFGLAKRFDCFVKSFAGLEADYSSDVMT